MVGLWFSESHAHSHIARSCDLPAIAYIDPPLESSFNWVDIVMEDIVIGHELFASGKRRISLIIVILRTLDLL